MPPNLYSAALLCLAWLLVRPARLSLSVGHKTCKDWDGEEYGCEPGNIPVVQPARTTSALSLCCALLPHSVTLPILKQGSKTGELGRDLRSRGLLDSLLSFCLCPAYSSREQKVLAGPAAQCQRVALCYHLPFCLCKHHSHSHQSAQTRCLEASLANHLLLPLKSQETQNKTKTETVGTSCNGFTLKQAGVGRGRPKVVLE